MAVALRLMRFGKKGYPTYRIVALDKRSKRDGYYIEKVGLYNPMNEANKIIVDEVRFNYWVTQGAQVSEGVRKLFKTTLPKPTNKVSKIKVRKIAKKTEEEVKTAPKTEPAKEVEAPTAAPETPVAVAEEPKAE